MRVHQTWVFAMHETQTYDFSVSKPQAYCRFNRYLVVYNQIIWAGRFTIYNAGSLDSYCQTWSTIFKTLYNWSTFYIICSMKTLKFWYKNLIVSRWRQFVARNNYYVTIFATNILHFAYL
jgi:hypothetical protein